MKEKYLYSINFIFEDTTDIEYQVYCTPEGLESEILNYKKIFEEEPLKVKITKYH